MADTAEVINRLFRVAIFQLAQCGAHATECLYFAVGTFGPSCNFLCARFLHNTFPPFPKAAQAQVPPVASAKSTGLQISVRVDGEAADSRATMVEVIPTFRGVDRAFELRCIFLPVRNHFLVA